MTYPQPTSPPRARDTLTERLADEITKRGYILCDNTGRAMEPDRRHVNVVSALFADKYLPQPLLSRIFRKKRRQRFVTIWTNSSLRSAMPDYWQMEVHGSEHFDAALSLRRELVDIFHVAINIKRASVEIEAEAFAAD